MTINEMTKNEHLVNDLLLSMSDSLFLIDVYNDMKVEENNYKISNLQQLKKIIVDLGFKIVINNNQRAIII